MKSAQLALALLLVLDSASARAWCRMTTSLRQPTPSEPCIFPDVSGDPPEHYLAWRRPCTGIALSIAAISADLTEDQVIGVLARSTATWEGVSCGGTAVGFDIGILEAESTCTHVLYRDNGPNVNALMFIADWGDRDYDPAAFAVTTVWHRRSTGEILDVDMEVNEMRGPFGICPAEGCLDERAVDLENVLTHELGHYLGLAHTTDPAATMFASAVAGETLKRSLEQDDIDGICTVYPPGTPAGECDYTPRGGLEPGCETGCACTSVGARPERPWMWLWVLAPLALFTLRRRARGPRSGS